MIDKEPIRRWWNSPRSDEVNVSEAAKILGVSKVRVRQFIAQGRLSAKRSDCRRALFLDKEAVLALSRIPRPVGCPPSVVARRAAGGSIPRHLRVVGRN